MYEQILSSIKSIVTLNAMEEKAFAELLVVKKLKKKDFLLQEGQVCNSISFVNSGCIRLFSNIDGEEKTVQFFFENGWYTDFHSFLTNTPSIENMQALEPCEVAQIRKSSLYQLYDAFPVFNRVGRLLTENAFLSVSRLNRMLTNEAPEQRYLSLLQQRPELIQRIPQHYIASYLGIQPESLSRIKKRILADK
jgi:CRP/FNR family transcriptional regulator, anaerobic regulatory protein